MVEQECPYHPGFLPLVPHNVEGVYAYSRGPMQLEVCCFHLDKPLVQKSETKVYDVNNIKVSDSPDSGEL